MTALKYIITEAKKLKKKFPKKEWKDLVKQASIIYKSKHKGKKPVVKKKTVSGVKKKTVKKTATKKPVKKSTGSYHKDTKSHNVNIKVVSGVNMLSNLQNLIKEKQKAKNRILVLQIQLKQAGTLEEKKHIKFWLSRYKKFELGLNKQIIEAKKHI